VPRYTVTRVIRECSADLSAADKGATTSRLAIAWVLAKSPAIVPLVGARTRTAAG